jgi:hypothetical protein
MKSSFMSKVKAGLKIIDRPWFYPIVLLLVGLAAYGIIFTRPGFYWDDWGKVYIYYVHNPVVSLGYSPSRPFTVWTYLFLFTFAKMTPLVWQILELIVRWLGILFIYYMLMAIWPRRVWQLRWVGVLLFVFPGFLSMPASVAFSDQLTVFLLLAISLFLTVKAIKSKKFFWLWMPVSVVLGIAQIFLIEYFVLLEVIRPVIIWFTLRSQQVEPKKALRKTILYWLPFALGIVVFVGWRLFYIPKAVGSDPNSVDLIKTFLSSPIIGLKTLLAMVIQDTVRLFTTIWAGTLSFDKFNILGSKIGMISWSVGIVVAVLVGLYLRGSSREEPAERDRSSAQMLVLGGVALLAGAFPVWATERFIIAGKWSDRFTLGPMLGVVILFVLLLDWLLRTRNQKQWLFAILLASSISLQIKNSNNFRLDWINQQNLYWQMAWRIPALKPGTAIIGSGTFTDKSSFYEGGFIVNLLLSNRLGVKAEYDYFDIWHLPASSYKPNLPLDDKLQASYFSGNTSQAIGMYFNIAQPGECVRLLDPVYTGDPKFNKGISNIIPISDLNNISIGDGSRAPNPAIFGTEPAHTWCYFFEKADLARQMQDWKTILSLGNQAKGKGLKPASGSEYLPFIEAFAQTGEWSQAYDLSIAAKKITQGLEPVLCNNWSRFQQITSGQDRETYLLKAKAEFCSEAALQK